MARRDTKKPFAISTTIIGSVALLAAVVLLRGPPLEEWYLRGGSSSRGLGEAETA